MIYSLQKKIIKISAVALSAVLLVIFILIAVFSTAQLNSAMDQLTKKFPQTADGFRQSLIRIVRINPHTANLQAL